MIWQHRRAMPPKGQQFGAQRVADSQGIKLFAANAHALVQSAIQNSLNISSLIVVGQTLKANFGTLRYTSGL
jgi:hypothetical protein